MKMLDKIILCLALCNILSAYNKLVAQSAGGIITQRGSQMGLVTFGPDVESGVLGEGSFVDGYVKKASSKNFVYPVGSNGAFRPFVAAADGTIGAYFPFDPGSDATRELFEEGPFNPALTDITTSAVSRNEYWDINGTNSTKITLTWNADSKVNTLLAGKNLSKLTIVGWDGRRWAAIKSEVDPESVLGGRSSAASGSITTTAELAPDTYNVYTLGAVAEGALPVVLASFHAKALEQEAHLDWETVSEINSSHFNIERSADAHSWQEIGRVDSRSETGSGGRYGEKYHFTDRQPLSGTSFYRLKMIDLDSSFAHSQLQKVTFENDLEAAVYPNPAFDKIYYKKATVNQVREARLFDVNGKSLKTVSAVEDGIEVSDLPKGMYVLNLMFGDGIVKSYKIFVKQ